MKNIVFALFWLILVSTYFCSENGTFFCGFYSMVRVTFEILRKMTKGFQRQNKKPRLECQMQSRRECSCVTNYSKCSTMHMIVGNVSNYRIFSRSYSVMIYVQNMTWFCSMLCSIFKYLQFRPFCVISIRPTPKLPDIWKA